MESTNNRNCAEWYYDQDAIDWGIGGWRCSKCHYTAMQLPTDKYMNVMLFAGSKFCPQCGAKIIGARKIDENKKN